MTDLPNTLTACPTRETLRTYLSGGLSDAETASVAEHVGSCAACRQLAGQITQSDAVWLNLTQPGGGTAPPTAEQEEPPPVLPGYVTAGRAGDGGMGVVWRVRDLHFHRNLAVKVLKASRCGDAQSVARFEREARITGQLAHPFVVPVHAMGRLPDGRPYYAMKLVEGRTLASLLSDRPANGHRWAELLQYFGQVCQAVAFAHSRGVIHRDLKPANVMVGEHGEVQVMDWGLAKVLAGPAADPVRADAALEEATEDTDDRTQFGSVLGTHAYMPPEQARGRIGEVDRRSDVFGLGAILCEILTGEPPYVGPGPVARARAQDADLRDALARLRACAADPELVRLAERCLAPRRDDRPADAGVVAREVARYLASLQERAERERLERVRAAERRRRRLWVTLTAALAAAAVGAVVLIPLALQWYAERQLRQLTEEAKAHNAHAYRMPDGKYMVRFNRPAAAEETERALREAVTAVIDRAERDGLTDQIGGIDLSGHGLSRVPPEVFCCRGLNTLYLKGNNIRDLPPDIGALSELTTLDLSQNQLEALPPEFNRLDRLAELNLSQNQFRTVPPQLFRLVNLKTLDLNRTNLTRLPPEIGRLEKLTKLHVPRNDLTELPPEIGDLRSLKALHLSNNKDLSRLPPEIGKLSNLVELYVSECRLTELPREIGGLTNLTTVHLSGNQLTALPPEVTNWRKLRTLDLRLNPLKELPPSIAEAFGADTRVQLGERDQKGGKHRP